MRLAIELKDGWKKSFTVVKWISSERCRDGMTHAHQGVRYHITLGKMLHRTSPQDMATHRL